MFRNKEDVVAEGFGAAQGQALTMIIQQFRSHDAFQDVSHDV
jgi:hypothetical protein